MTTSHAITGHALPPPLPHPSACTAGMGEHLDYTASQDPENAQAETPARWHVERLPGILRALGGGLLGLSIATFMFNGWLSVSPLTRYYGFLGFTSLLALLGVFCVVRWNESKGGRTFLGLAAATLPAHALQLGGLLYLTLGGSGGHLPAALQVFHFGELSPLVFGLTFLLSSTVLSAIVYTATASMARPLAKPLTLICLGGSALLMVPLRDPGTVALLCILGFIGLRLADRRWLGSHPRMDTFDGQMMRVVAYAPIPVLALRSVMLFGYNAWPLAALGALTLHLLWYVTPKVFSQRPVQQLARVLSLPIIGVTWLCIAEGLGLRATHGLALVPATFILGALSFTVPEGGRLWRVFASISATTILLAYLGNHTGNLAAVACLASGSVLLIGAFVLREKALLAIGAVNLSCGTFFFLREVIVFGMSQGWVALGVVGASAIIVATLIERRGKRLATRLSDFRADFANWQ